MNKIYRYMKKKKKRKLKVGDIVYFETPCGIYEDTIIMIDGQALTLSDYSYLHMKDVLSKDDSRIKNSKGRCYSVPPKDLLKQQYNVLNKKGC